MNCEDIDGNVYETIRVGDKIWMAENLRVSHYTDGSKVRHEPDPKRWKQMNTGAYCWYNNKESNDMPHGKLYNWYAAVNSVDDNQKLCPVGWRMPTDMDWDDLARDLDPKAGKVFKRKTASKNAGAILKSKDGSWSEAHVDNTTDIGFNALPSGKRHKGKFRDGGKSGNWWSSGELEMKVAWYRVIHDGYKSLDRENYYKDTGFSIRCVKDVTYRTPQQEENTEDAQPNKYDEIEQLKKLLDMGAINQEEFDAEKKKILSKP
jgi:uncharacterized protein (TIGR02145 family)